jgi:hypothetical protein
VAVVFVIAIVVFAGIVLALAKAVEGTFGHRPTRPAQRRRQASERPD